MKGTSMKDSIYKAIILRMSYVGEFVDPDIALFGVRITPKQATRIIKMSEVCEKHDYYQIRDFDWSGDYTGAGEDFDVLTDPKDQLKFIQDYPHRTDGKVISVGRDYFWWSAYPKHSTNDCKITTRAVPTSFLTSPKTFWVDID